MQIIVNAEDVVLAVHDDCQDIIARYPAGCRSVFVSNGVECFDMLGKPRALADILEDSDVSGAALAELAALGLKLPRAVEDLVDAGAVAESSLPAIMQTRLARKRELRAVVRGV